MERASFLKATRLPVNASVRRQQHQSDQDLDLERWLARRVGNIDHEKRVLQIAMAFHDMTRDLHSLSRRGSWALMAAALVHDVGRSIDADRHEHIGAKMLIADSRLNLSSSDRRALAYLTRYHRGTVPDLGEDEILRPTDNRQELLKVLGLLRAADTLDSRSLTPPRLLLARRQRSLDVQCVVDNRCSRAKSVFCRPKKFRLMEEMLDCTINVSVRQ